MAPSGGYFMPGRRNRPGLPQRGVALITVLLIVAVLTAIVSRLSFSNQVWLRQVANGTALIQSGQATRAAQHWAAIILQEDRKKNDYDGYTDSWARPLPPVPVGHGFVRGHMEDAQARFNLNNLCGEIRNGRCSRPDLNAVEQFRRLLQVLDLNPDIADAAVDWVDDNDDPAGIWGAEDGYYLGMNPPYLAANRLFKDAAELRLIRGVNRTTWRQLKPYVTALPKQTPVNINTASPAVLAAVITEWGPPRNSLSKAEGWSRIAGQNPCRAINNDCYKRMDIDDPELEQNIGRAANSDFFMARTQVDIGHVQRRMATLYRRGNDGVSVISQKRELK